MIYFFTYVVTPLEAYFGNSKEGQLNHDSKFQSFCYFLNVLYFLIYQKIKIIINCLILFARNVIKSTGGGDIYLNKI